MAFWQTNQRQMIAVKLSCLFGWFCIRRVRQKKNVISIIHKKNVICIIPVSSFCNKDPITSIVVLTFAVRYKKNYLNLVCLKLTKTWLILKKIGVQFERKFILIIFLITVLAKQTYSNFADLSSISTGKFVQIGDVCKQSTYPVKWSKYSRRLKSRNQTIPTLFVPILLNWGSSDE